jgi:tetratricopeptide (TPR) repeat protein
MLDPALIPYVQRLDRDPEDADALANVWRILDAKGDHQTLAKLAEKVAARQRTPAVAVALLHRTAELWSREIGRDDQAIALWQRVLSVDPDHEDAALALASAYARTGRIDLASPLHARLLERTRDPEKRVALLEQIAALKREAGDIEGEVQALRDILKVGAPVANTINHRRALAKILVQRGRAASGTNESETHPDIIEAARILGSIAREGGLGRGTDFATAALALWPGEENAFQVLQAALSLRHAELIALRIRFLAANPTSPIVSQVRADLADSYLAAGRVDDAISVLATAALEDASAGQQLARLYERTGRHRDLAALLASTPLPKDPVARVVLLRRRAAAHRAAGDRPALLAALRDVLNEAPADLEALPEVERDLRMRGALDEVRERLRAAGAVATAPVAMRVKWLREVALLSERHFNDAAGAIEAWETIARVSEEVADIEEAHASLDRLLGRAGRWEDLLARFEARAGQALDAPTRRAWWTRWLEVHREHRRDPAQEATVLTQLLADDPNDDPVALALIDARRRAGDNAGVESLLRALIARATPSTVGMRWSQLAGHLEQNKDTRGALEAWRQARTLDPSQAMAWSAEERILEAAGDFEALVDVLVAHASHPTAAGRRAGDLYARAADLSQRFGLDAQAARLVKDLLRERTRQGCAVILTTHILEVAERLADRIGIIQHGRLVAEGGLADLRAQAGGDHSTLEEVFLRLTGAPADRAA